MAFIPQNDEEENKQSTNTNQVLKLSDNAPGSQPTTGGGGVGSSPSGVGPNGGQANAGFAGIMDYLGANKDQAAPMANQISGNLGQQFNDTKSTIDSAVQNAGTDVTKGTVNYNGDLVNGAVADPAAFVKDPNNLSTFSAQRDANYGGPGSFEDTSYYGGASKAATKANDTYTAAKSTPGYSGLLSQIETNPTAGKSALDSGILQTDPNAQGTINNALSPFAGIQDYLKSASTGVNKNIQGAKDTTAATAAKTKQAVADSEGQFEGRLGNKVSDATTSVAANTKAAQDLFANISNTDLSKVPDSLISSMGLTRDDLAKMQTNQRLLQQGFTAPGLKSDDPDFIPSTSADYNQYLHAPTAINPQTVASNEDYARSQALAQLMGEGHAPYLDPSQSGMAGTGLNPSFDKTAESGFVDPQIAALQKASQDYQGKIQATLPDSLKNIGSTPRQPGEGFVSTDPVGGNPQTPTDINAPTPTPSSPGVVTTPENAGAVQVQKSIADEKARNKAAGTKGATFGFGTTPGVF